MKLDFTVWAQEGLAPDLFSDLDDRRHLDMNRMDVSVLLANATLPLPGGTQVHLHYGMSNSKQHTSVVLTNACEPDYPHLMSGRYADLLPVWHSYAVLLFSGGQ